ERLRELRGQVAVELELDLGEAGHHREARGADPEQRVENARALDERAVARRTRRAPGSAFANLDFVEERRITHRHACIGARRADDLEERAHAHRVEAALDLAVLLEPHLETSTRTERFTNAQIGRASWRE